MKKILFFLTIIAVTFVSCKKNNGPGHNPLAVDSLKIGLIAYYPFNNSAADLSGNNYNGVAHGVTATANRNGVANSAYYFSGDSTSYITIPDNQELRITSTDFTINAWVKLATYNTSFSSAIFDKRTPTTSGYYLGVNGTGGQAPAGSIGFGPGGGLLGITSTPLIDTVKWHMVTVVYTLASQQVSVYIDGTFDSAATGIATPNSANNAAIYIGKDNPASASTYSFEGAIDDIRVYNRAVPSDQVTKLYTSAN